jgi:uncharacterized protein YndB with AHSA1/START domain
MGKVTAAIELPYAIDDVFRVATRVEDMPRWLPEVVAAELLDPALVAGARIRLRLGPGTGNAEITGTIAELRPPTLLEITGSGGPLSIKVWTVLEPRGTATRVSLELELSTPPFLGFIAKEAERRINAELPASLERFRSLMEADQAGRPDDQAG